MDGTARDAPLVDIDTATGFGDSLPRLLALSEVAPVVRVPYAGGHVHVVAEPGLVRRVLLDRRFSKQPRHAPDWLDDPLIRLATSNGMTALLLEEGAEHTRLRRLHMTVFGTREVRAREAAIAGIAQRLVDDLGGTREADLVAAVAYPLPVHVISEIIGLPPEVRATMRAASEDISFGSGATIGRGVQRLYETVGRLVHHERHRLLPGLITGLLDHGEREPGSVSDAEVVFWSAGCSSRATNPPRACSPRRSTGRCCYRTTGARDPAISSARSSRKPCATTRRSRCPPTASPPTTWNSAGS